ncbi:MAG: hypothetical protein QM689_04315 [Oscillospiraceae bacterium]
METTKTTADPVETDQKKAYRLSCALEEVGIYLERVRSLLTLAYEFLDDVPEEVEKGQEWQMFVVCQRMPLLRALLESVGDVNLQALKLSEIRA